MNKPQPELTAVGVQCLEAVFVMGKQKRQDLLLQYQHGFDRGQH